MNTFTLATATLRSQKLLSGLNVLLLTLGIATIVVLLLFNQQLKDTLTRNAEGIDLVVGAKGSPLQLILSSIYHADVPTGNISLAEAEEVAGHRLVKQAIPLALGDNYHGYRIVGSTHDYPALYSAELDTGRLWTAPMEVTVGAGVARDLELDLGDSFVGMHGLGHGGLVHEGHPYEVVGIFKPTGTVIDRLILTPVESVWLVHDEHHNDDHEHDNGHKHEHARDHEDADNAHENHRHEDQPAAHHHEDTHHHDRHTSEHTHQDEHHAQADHDVTAISEEVREVTALLIQYRSPLAAAMLPRWVNAQGALQAASPAYETARLLQLVGGALEAVRAFGLLLLAAAALSIFVTLYSTLERRQYEMALLRTLGASRGRVMAIVMLEGLLLALAGALLGLALGHAAAEMIGTWLAGRNQLIMTGLTWVTAEWYLLPAAALLGLVAAIIPALRLYRMDVAGILAKS